LGFSPEAVTEKARLMANKTLHLPIAGQAGHGQTLRTDNWRTGPIVTFIILTSFLVYATFRAFEGTFYRTDLLGIPYLSPFASPFIDTSFAKHWPLPFALTPAMLILAGPASFRFTCYYYRKAYYRAFAQDPPGCAVGEYRGHKYNGETKLLIFQNLHRFALYAAIVFLLFLWHDAFEGVFGWQGGGVHMGVGSIVLIVNCTLLSGYTFGCHAFRHLVGGNINSYSQAPLGMLRYKIWQGVSKLNMSHMQWAWTSLFGVALTDLYIRAVASGMITDMRLF
jgi:hypothetical protein